MFEPSLDVFVDRLSSRTPLTEAERGALASLDFETRRLQPNQDFISAGECTHHLDIMLAGMGARFDINEQGARQLTALHLTGDAANPRSIVQPRSLSSHVALVPSTVARISIEPMRKIAFEVPAIMEALWREAAVDAEIVTRWLVNLGRRDARTRIAHLFCELAVRSGGGGQGTEIIFSMPLTQEHLGDATGLTAVHVNRVLKVLRGEGLLLLRDREAHIPD